MNSRMKALISQIQLEEMLGIQTPADPNELPPRFAVIYFTASWCGACRALNLDQLQKMVPSPTWYKCDVDQNQYSPGFCNVRAIPTFVVVLNQKVVGTLQSNNTEKVIAWLKEFVDAAAASK